MTFTIIPLTKFECMYGYEDCVYQYACIYEYEDVASPEECETDCSDSLYLLEDESANVDDQIISSDYIFSMTMELLV